MIPHRFSPSKSKFYLYFQQFIRKELQPIKLNKERLVFFSEKNSKILTLFLGRPEYIAISAQAF
jgi:hypothetical protein